MACYLIFTPSPWPYQCGFSIVTEAICPDIAGAAEIGRVIFLAPAVHIWGQETVACLLIEVFVFQAVFFIFTLMLLSFSSLIRFIEKKYLVNFKKIWFRFFFFFKCCFLKKKMLQSYVLSWKWDLFISWLWWCTFQTERCKLTWY